MRNTAFTERRSGAATIWECMCVLQEEQIQISCVDMIGHEQSQHKVFEQLIDGDDTSKKQATAGDNAEEE